MKVTVALNDSTVPQKVKLRSHVGGDSSFLTAFSELLTSGIKVCMRQLFFFPSVLYIGFVYVKYLDKGRSSQKKAPEVPEMPHQ